MNNHYLKDIIERVDLTSKKVAGAFGFLTEDQINWRDEEDSWSIAQCLHHVILFNKSYFPTFLKIADGHKRKRKRERLPIFPDVWGNYYLNSLKTNNGKRTNTHPSYLPSNFFHKDDILNSFSNHQGGLIELLRKLDKVDHDETILTSPVQSYVTMSLKDVCRMIALHEERHLNQALTVKNDLSFPKLS